MTRDETWASMHVRIGMMVPVEASLDVLATCCAEGRAG